MKRFFDNMTIAKKLTGGVVLLLILVSAGIGIMSYLQAYSAVQSQLEENTPQIARYGAMVIRKQLNYYRVAMEGIANLNVIKTMDWAEQQPMLKSEVARLGCLQIGIASPNGKTLLNDGTSTNIKDRAYFKDTMTGKSVISDVIIHKILNKPVQVVAVPIRVSESRIVGVIFAVLNATWLSEFTDQIGYGKNGYSYIIDGKGTFIAYKNRDDVLKQRNLIEESKTNSEFARVAAMFQRMIKGESGFDEYPFTGSNRIFGYAPIEGTGWSLAVGAHKADVFQQVATMRLSIIIISLAFIVIGIILIILLSYTITRPIDQTVNMLKNLSEGEGDLTKRLAATSNDEIGKMTRYFNQFIEKLHGVIISIVKNTDEVAASSEEMSSTSNSFTDNAQNQAAVAEEVTATIEEVSAGIENVASRSLDQYNRLGGFIEQMQKLSETINEMGGKLTETVNISSDIATTAKSGEESLNNMSASMSRITNSSREMTGIVDMINDISDQINLLSLNAAIEAARAGDAGRGFAVVADEISKLADKTASSIKEINKFIHGNNEEINKGMENVKSAIDTISTIISGVNRIVEMMNILGEFMKQQLDTNAIVNRDALEMRNRSDEIRSATEEQKIAIAEIVKSVSNINEYTQANASGAEEMSGTAESTSVMAENLKKAVGYFKV